MYVAFDPSWTKRLGDGLTALVGFVVTLRLLQVFPFDVAGSWAWAETPLRAVLVLGCAGAAIGAVTNLAMLLRDGLVGVADR